MQIKRESLIKIDEALHRLEAGEFGRCAVCGDEISEQRLSALPFALRCTECESAREARLKAGQSMSRRIAGNFGPVS